MERRRWVAGSFMVGYSPRVVGAGPRACPGGTSRNGGQTGRTQGSAPTLRPALKRCAVSLWDGFSSRRIDRKALRGMPPAM
ncbi:hypothetical protein GKODMF_04945 [Candidatus Electrothrix gigas]